MWHMNKAKINMSHEFYIVASVICEFEYQHRNDLSLELYNLLIFTFFVLSKAQNFLKPCTQREVWSFSLYIQVMSKVLKYIGLINNIFLEFMCKQHQNPNQPPALPSLLPLCYPLQHFNNFASKEAAIKERKIHVSNWAKPKRATGCSIMITLTKGQCTFLLTFNSHEWPR